MPQPNARPQVYFGDFELDPAAYELRRKGKPVRLEKQPMELLLLLAEHRGRLVSRSEIVARLWGDGVFVDVETGVNTAMRKVRQALGESPESPVFIETVSGKGYRFIYSSAKATSISPPPLAKAIHRTMLVVLPFENLSSDPEQEYFSDGLTEETISYLGRINPERMGVIARTTSMAYKRTPKSIREIGAELKVDYVLESSVRREDNRVRVASQLIRVEDQTHIWASVYERELTGILAIQNDLGTDIASQVLSHISREQPLAVEAHTANPEAYDLYLRGRYFWNQLSPATTKRAMEFFSRATALDPNHALAWSGTADALAASPISADAAPLQVQKPASQAANLAIQAAPDLAETQTSFGFVKFWLDWDWDAAEAAFRRAVALNPSYPMAHRMLGIILSHLQEPEESLAAVKRARELDPLNPTQYALSSQVAFGACEFELAVTFALQAIAIDPEFWISHMQLGQAYEQLGKLDSAVDELVRAQHLSGGNSKPISLRGYTLARMGRVKEAEDVLSTLQTASQSRYIPPYALALIGQGLGRTAFTLEGLQRSLEAHDVHLAFLTCDPKWDALRTDPAFVDVLERCAFSRRLRNSKSA